MKLGLLGLFLLSFGVFAKVDFKTFKPSGGVTSGGGYVIVCEEDKTVELLDFFEASQTIRGYALRDLPAGNDVYQKAHAVIDRIQIFSKEFNQVWHKTLDEFKNGDMTFIDRGVITDINDGRTVVSPSRKCFKVQAGLQVKNPGPYQYRVMIDKDIWNKMNDFTKVGLLVHEVIYKTALAQGHEDSDKVRLVNSFLFSKYTEKFNEFDYLEIFQFAKVDGCFESPIKFTSPGSSQTFNFSFSTKDFSKFDYGFKGKFCQDEILRFIEGGELVAGQGTTVYLNDPAISPHNQNVCFSNGNAVFVKDEMEFLYKACFLTNTDTERSALIFSGNSSLSPASRFFRKFSFGGCGNQEIYNYQVKFCGLNSAVAELEKNQVRFVQWKPGVNEDTFWIEDGFWGLNVGLYGPVQVESEVNLDRKGKLVFTSFADRSIALNESTYCEVLKGDQLIYDADSGQFESVKPRTAGSYPEGSCAKYFAERDSQENSK